MENTAHRDYVRIRILRDEGAAILRHWELFCDALRIGLRKSNSSVVSRETHQPDPRITQPMNNRLHRLGSSRRPLATGCALLLGFAGAAFAQYTGEFSATNLGTGNFDDQVGLRASKEYFAAINLGSTFNLTINGVNFTGVG